MALIYFYKPNFNYRCRIRWIK